MAATSGHPPVTLVADPRVQSEVPLPQHRHKGVISLHKLGWSSSAVGGLPNGGPAGPQADERTTDAAVAKSSISLVPRMCSLSAKRLCRYVHTFEALQCMSNLMGQAASKACQDRCPTTNDHAQMSTPNGLSSCQLRPAGSWASQNSNSKSWTTAAMDGGSLETTINRM